MAYLAKPFALAQTVAASLGVDQAQVSRIVIDIQAESPPRFRVSGWLTVEQGEQLIRIFEATTFQETAVS